MADFLIELSIGLHKNAIYPPGHPLLEHTSSELKRRLDILMKEREALSLGVARHQLIIEGVATDDKNPVLRELAVRLHKHHLGAVKFTQGVSEDELIDMLSTVSVDAGRSARPLGLEGPEVLAQWAHIRLFPMTFAQLQLIEESPDAAAAASDDQIRASTSGSRSAQLWIGLARAALVNQSGVVVDEDDAASSDPKMVAAAIEETKRDSAYDQVVVGYLLQIAEELKVKGGRDAAALTKRVSQLVSQLSPDALKRLLAMGGDVRQRRQFVNNASQGMAVDAVVELVKAAAETSGQTVSTSMVRMLSKMAAHADGGTPDGRVKADGALREQVQQLMAGWELEDPNPDGYRITLDNMSKRAPLFVNTDHSIPIEPERLLMMGLEIETLGDQVWRSADMLVAKPDLTPLLDTVDNAPAPWIRDALWRHIATPERLRVLLTVDPFPTAVIHRVVVRMGVAAVDPILDAMDDALDEKSIERLTELLAVVGAQAGAPILARLTGLRWALVRPLIVLLGKHAEWACGYDAAQFLAHPDALVRREALRQQLRRPETHDVAIVRALGIRALASHKGGDTAAWLASRVVKMGKLLKRPALVPKSPEMLAALEGLATHWRNDKMAREAIALAAASSDDEIRGAVQPRGSSA